MKNFYLKISYATILALLIFAALFLYVDRSVAFAVQSLANTWLYTFSMNLSAIGKPARWISLAFIVAILVLLTRIFKKRSIFLDKILFVCSCIILAGLITIILKNTLARYRPIELLQYGYYGFHFFAHKWSENSTPSGHATVAFALAFSLNVAFHRRWAILFFIWPIAMSIARVVVDQHFVSDVFLGAYIGIISVVFIRHILKEKLNLS